MSNVRVSPFNVDGVAEVVILCVDTSGSMGQHFESGRSRLDAVKQMFYGFRDQTSSLMGGRHRLGLLSYSNAFRINVHTKPTSNLGMFEAAIDKMDASGGTATFAAIVQACELLKPWAGYPVDLRVICLSDGDNNCRDVRAHEAAEACHNVGATCDCIIVGNTADEHLRRVVTATHGKCFQINNLQGAYETLESPAVVSMSARRGGATRPPRPESPTEPWSVVLYKEVPAPMIVGAVRADDAGRPLVLYSVDDIPAAVAAASGRIAKELVALAAQDVPGIEGLRVQAGHEEGADKLTCAKIFVTFDLESPYAAGVFEIAVDFPDEYPFTPPRMRVVTSIYHYAIDTQGHTCLASLRAAPEGSWGPQSRLAGVLEDLASLVNDPAAVDPAAQLSQRAFLSEELRVNPARYHEKARAATEALASGRTLDEMAQLEGGQSAPNANAVMPFRDERAIFVNLMNTSVKLRIALPKARRLALQETVRAAPTIDAAVDILMQNVNDSPYIPKPMKEKISQMLFPVRQYDNFRKALGCTAPNNHKFESEYSQFRDMVLAVFSSSRIIKRVPLSRRRLMGGGIHKARNKDELRQVAVKALETSKVFKTQGVRDRIANDIFEERYDQLLLPSRLDCDTRRRHRAVAAPTATALRKTKPTLPHASKTNSESAEDDEEAFQGRAGCGICLGENPVCARLRCGHEFCKTCIFGWTMKVGKTCPRCNVPMKMSQVTYF